MSTDDTIVVFGELESDSETIFEASEAGTFIFKNVSCQTDFDHEGDTGVPIVFSGLFQTSMTCVAFTQANIPLEPDPNVRMKYEITPPVNVKMEPDVVYEKEKDTLLENTIENVVQRSKKRLKIPSFEFDSGSEDLDDDLPVSITSREGGQFNSCLCLFLFMYFFFFKLRIWDVFITANVKSVP